MTPEGYPETVEEYQEFLAEMNEFMLQLNTQQPQQPQQSGDQGGPSMSMDMMDMFGGAGAGTGGSSSVAGGPGGVGGGTSTFFAGGEGAAGGGSAAASNPYGAIAALIAAIGYGQSKATGGNSRTIEGQKTGDWFEGGGLRDRSPMTEPWFAALREKWGLSATAGEKFDAAWKNKDTGKMLERLPAAADYWADPIRKWISTGSEKGIGELTGSKKAGKLAGKITDPIGTILGLFGK